MGWQHSIAGGQGNLIGPVFKSPNYVPGVSGWAVFIDGSAEFNNLVIRGTFKGTDFEINASGAFFYSGPPAAGNLVASIASLGGADGFGNNYGGGIFAYGASTVGGLSTLAALQGGDVLIQGTGFPYLITVDSGSGMLSIGVPHGGVQVFTDGSFFYPSQPGTSDPEDWHVIGQPGEPAFGTGFGAPGGDQTARFRLEADGTVALDGVALTTAATAANAVLFTLPLPAYIPQKRKRFAGVTSASGYTTPGQTLVNVAPATGVVSLVPACSGAGQQIVLDGMTFKVN